MIPVGYVENVGERLDDLFIFLGKKLNWCVARDQNFNLALSENTLGFK